MNENILDDHPLDEQKCSKSSDEIRQLFPRGNVGFDSLPYQIVRKRLQDGFVFNVLLVGETGIGKSTLISSLFGVPLNSPATSHRTPKLALEFQRHELCEKDVNLVLNVIETVGYGDQIDRKDNVEPIAQYLESQLENYLNEELKNKRNWSLFRDTRVHVCLYLVSPTGHGLRSIDSVCMKRLQQVVNVIPVIAKSDALTKTELLETKAAVKRDLEGIDVYRFPEDDELGVDVNRRANEAVPFAVSASADWATVDGKAVRAREFPWGTMVVEDEEHSEFLRLKDMLVVTNMEDLRERTHHRHYERRRRRRLTELGFSEFSFEDLVNRRRELSVLVLKEEEELRERFVRKTRDAEKGLRQRERSFRKKCDREWIELEKQQREILDEKEELEYEMRHLLKKKSVLTF